MHISHFILTRMSYHGCDVRFVRRRWELTKSICAESLAMQSCTRFVWLVRLHSSDVLLAEKLLYFRSLPFAVVPVYDGSWPDAVALATDYGLPATGRRRLEPVAECNHSNAYVLTTRIDDDDAFAGDVIARVQTAAENRIQKSKSKSRTVFVFPNGYRLTGIGIRGTVIRVSRVWQINNQFPSLLIPQPSTLNPLPTVMDVKHGQIGRLGSVQIVDDRPAWLWVRHADAKSKGGFSKSGQAPSNELKAWMLIDWNTLC